jgi:hypothetical protein
MTREPMTVFHSDGTDSSVGNYPLLGYTDTRYRIAENWDFNFD